MTDHSGVKSAKELLLKSTASAQSFQMDSFNKVIETAESILAHRRKMPKGKAEEIYCELQVKYLTQCRDAKLNGKPLVWPGLGPNALLDAMDLAPYPWGPLTFGVAQSLNLTQEFLQAGAETGLLPFLCTQAVKIAMGGAALGYLLAPDLLVSTTYLCTTMCTGVEFWSYYSNIPCYRIDRPTIYSESAVQYHTKQLEDLVRWLEEQTGHKMDWDKLQVNVEALRQARELRREIAELRKAIPHPMRGKQTSQCEVVDMAWAGRPEAVGYFRQLRDELKERVDKKIGAIGNERLRLILPYMPPVHALKIFDWLEVEWGAVCVMEPLFESMQCGYVSVKSLSCELDPKKPLESLARDAFMVTRQAPGEIVLEDIITKTREHSADGVVWYSPYTCNESFGLIQMTRDALKKEGIPMLSVDVDYADPSYLDFAGMREKTEPFLEMLCERKGV